MRGEARSAIDRIVDGLRHFGAAGAEAPATPVVGSRVAIGGMGLEGVVVSIDGNQAEIDMRGKRVRAKVKELRVLSAPQGAPPSREASAGQAPQGRVRVTVDLAPREGMLSELKVIGMTVDEAIDRVARFLDDTLVTGIQEVRIVHGHGTGQLRKGLHAYLRTNPLVRKYYAAPENQGGGGATIVELTE